DRRSGWRAWSSAAHRPSRSEAARATSTRGDAEEAVGRVEHGLTRDTARDRLDGEARDDDAARALVTDGRGPACAPDITEELHASARWGDDVRGLDAHLVGREEARDGDAPEVRAGGALELERASVVGHVARAQDLAREGDVPVGAAGSGERPEK